MARNGQILRRFPSRSALPVTAWVPLPGGERPGDRCRVATIGVMGGRSNRRSNGNLTVVADP
jgi:hypothetical protein